MGSRDKVLIVDDSELDRIALKKMLKDAYEIVEAVDGAGALRILESQKEFDAISAIILDLVMPQMDGFEFLREYRKVDSYRRIPVIVASVERDVKTEKACLALGARDFIGKPYDPQIVRFRVENAVRSSEQQLSRELRYRAITICSPEFTIRRISLKQPVFCLRDIQKRRMRFYASTSKSSNW